MSAILAIAGVELRRFLRDKSNIFFVFIFPLVLILLLGSQFGAGSGQARVGISGPGGAVPQALAAKLAASGAEVIFADADTVRAELSRGRTDVGLFIDDAAAADFDSGRPAGLAVVMASQSSAQAVMQEVRTAVQAVSMEQRQLAALTGAGIPADQAKDALDRARQLAVAPTVEITDTNEISQEFRGLGRFDLGASQQLLLFVFLSSLTGAATLIQARRFGVVGRVLAAPVSSGQTVAGQALGRFAIALVQGSYIMIGTAVLFGVQWGNLWLSALVLTLFCAVSAAAAMVVGSVMDNDAAAAGIGVGGGLVLGGLGGSMVPPEFFPAALRTVSYATPHRWAYDALADIQRHEGTLADILPQLGVLALMAAFLLLVGARLLRRSLTRAL
ncbi:ABC transporter permease [Arthrobacter sp. CG_A4]|uniref:ABC transporter permease n=1 Tax=Arthrobacter sp. CG_A4 TaxID=3071706 RepID=UPI002E0366E4|nr:ABC-2 type transport system permease protein [Arthrobacter sp. CG_A4]